MRNIIKFLLCIGIFLIAKTNVLAEQNYIYLGDAIANVRLYLKTEKIEKYKNMYKIINRDTNELVYCIEPGVVLKGGYFKTYQGVELIPDDLGITNDDWNNLLTIAYFGYGYQDRLDIKWYVTTQFMIWEYLLDGKGEVYFVDNNNHRIDLFKEEMEIIKKDIENYFVFPSFLENNSFDNIKYNDTVTLVDENHVLKDCLVYISNGEYEINDNKITIKFNTPGEQILNFTKKIDITATPKIFYNSASQTVINKGIIKTPFKVINVNVEFPNFTLIKKSIDNINLSIKGAKYGIYYEDGSLYQVITTDEFGKAYLDKIDIGKYYLQEIEAPFGYKLNEEKLYFEVNGDVYLETYEEAIKKEIVVEKYLENVDGTLELESGATFEVYDEKNEIIQTFKTDEFGKYILELPYGTYTLKQITSKVGYNYARDIKLTINDETSNRLIIKNPQIIGSILVEKRDKETNELIEDEMHFKIYDVDRKIYLNNGEVFKTIDGKALIDNIPYGNYELVEIEAPFGYKLTNEKYSFQINNDEKLNIIVLNELIGGSIQIEKLDDETLKPIVGVIFGLYDKDKNLIKEYETDKDGKIMITNVLEGLYYIKELKTPLEYNILEGFVEVNVKNNVLSELKITNRLKVIVPKTGVNELLLTVLFTGFCLLVGIIICNYDKNS